MNSAHAGLAFNLLNTLGHQDFGENSHRFGWALSNHAVAVIAWYLGAHQRPGSGWRFALEGVGNT